MFLYSPLSDIYHNVAFLGYISCYTGKVSWRTSYANFLTLPVNREPLLSNNSIGELIVEDSIISINTLLS